jgi:hypothetical protein
MPVVYSHPSGFRVEVRTADAFDLPADALVFGGSVALRRRLESLAGKRFRPFEHANGVRPADLLLSDRLPWRKVVSYRYHPRRTRIFWPTTSPAPPAAHILTLTSELFWLLRSTERGLTFPERVLLLPLGWRCPEVSSAAWTAALWRYGEERQRDVSARTFILADMKDSSPYLPLLDNRNAAMYQMLRGWDFTGSAYVHPFRQTR